MNAMKTTTRERCAAVVRQGYDALNRGKVSELAGLIHPDFRCDAPAGVLRDPAERGPSFFERCLREVTNDWDEFHCELEELRHAGELIVALVLEEGRERSTGEWARRESFHIWTIRDSRAVRFGRHPRVRATA